MAENPSYFNISQKFKAKNYVCAKLILFYTLLYTASFVFGCFLLHFIDVASNSGFNSSIVEYFSVSFSNCESVFDYASLLLLASRNDIYCLAAIFSASFTMLSGIIISSILFFRGFSLGFSSSYLVLALKEHYISIDHPYISIILYYFTSAIIAAVLIVFSVKSLSFCNDFKALCGNARKIFRSQSLYSHIYYFIFAIGTFLMINLIRFIF